jgi:hypothetical protein
VVLAEEVVSGDGIVVFDVAFARALRSAATPQWERVFAWVSWLGRGDVLGVASYLLLRYVRSWTVAAAAVTLSSIWCLVMAFSRLYLGEHFASDALAGLFAGAAWVAVCVSAFEILRRRGDR